MYIRLSPILLSLATLSMGCPRPLPPRPPKPPEVVKPYKISVEAGDTLQIEVFGEKDLSGKFQVADGGTIDYPLVGRVKVAGLTPPAVATLLRRKLAAGYLRKPSVAVFAEGYSAKKKIYIWGHVRKSGTYSYTTNMTIIEALTMAGGLSPLANKNGIVITRVENGRRKEYSLPMGHGQSSSYPLRPGDVIYVPESVF